MPNIHPSAVIDPRAQIADTVVIGPYCIVGGGVSLDEGVELISHVVINGRTRIGARTRVFPFSSLGMPPQDLKYKGEASELVIGQDCLVREHVTVNPGTEGGGMITRVGNQVLLAIGCHIAHDCVLGDNVLVMNHVLVGGHVVVGEGAVLGGGSAVHQFVRLGRYAMIGGMSGVVSDVIPYGMVVGNRGHLEGLNIVGMKRHGHAREEIHAMRNAYKMIFADGEEALAARLDGILSRYPESAAVADTVAFLKADSSRGICRPLSVNDV